MEVMSLQVKEKLLSLFIVDLLCWSMSEGTGRPLGTSLNSKFYNKTHVLKTGL